MSLIGCPLCGSIFEIRKGECPTCNYRVPATLLHPDGPPATPERPALVARTGQWFRHLADAVHSALTPRH